MVVNAFDIYGGVFAVEEGFHLVGPFDEAVVAAVEVVLEADAGGVVGLVDAVEVEVVERLAVVCPVFIDDGEGGEVMSLSTPSCRQISLMRVVLPVPISPKKPNTRSCGCASKSFCATSGSWDSFATILLFI